MQGFFAIIFLKFLWLICWCAITKIMWIVYDAQVTVKALGPFVLHLYFTIVGLGIRVNCEAGRYGEMCERQCIGNCKNNICNRVTGRCDGKCAAGWNGSSCSEGHKSFFHVLYIDIDYTSHFNVLQTNDKVSIALTLFFIT